MSELSRKQRKRRAERKMKNNRLEKTYSKKRHKCVFHDYEKQPDGTYLCLKCGYHFYEPMDDEKLYKYISSRNEYSFKELKEMTKFLKVIYGKGIDGEKTIYKAKEITTIEALRIISDFKKWFGCITENLQFEKNGMIQEKCARNIWEQRTNKGDKASFEELEALLECKILRCETIDIYNQTECEWSFLRDGQIYYFEVFPKYLNVYSSWFDFETFESVRPKLAIRKVIFSKDLEVQKMIVRFIDGKILSLTN